MDASGRLTAALKESTGDNDSAYGSSVAHSILFKLPRELRDYIYEYVFSGTRFHVTKHGGIPEPALLVTCKIIRDEAILTFYGDKKRLLLDIVSYDPAVLQLWCTKHRHLQRNHVIGPPMPSHRHIGTKNWNNLKRAIQLRHGKLINGFRRRPPGSPRYTDEKFFIVGLFTVADEMENRPWEAVEAVLDMLRPGLNKLDQGWALY